MKIIVSLFIIFFINLFPYSKSNEVASYPSNYIVMDQGGEILEGNRYHQKRSIASITKIMTSLLALEYEELYFRVITVNDIVNTIEGSSLYLERGSTITYIDLIYGLLLRSGNDAAVLLAQEISGSVDEFVSLMNQKAQEIGMLNTTFNNPTGLDIYDEGNYSTPYDVALLMKYALSNEMFVQISSTKYYKTPVKGMWKNKNRLLFDYEYCISGKTGYTKKAKRTLVTASKKNDTTLICVTFNYGDDFSFHKQKYESYFSSYRYVLFLKKGINNLIDINIESNEDIGIFVPIKEVGIKKYIVYKDEGYIRIYYLSKEGRIIKEKIAKNIKIISPS